MVRQVLSTGSELPDGQAGAVDR